MTITIELGPKTIKALAEALVPKSPIQDIPKLKPGDPIDSIMDLTPGPVLTTEEELDLVPLTEIMDHLKRKGFRVVGNSRMKQLEQMEQQRWLDQQRKRKYVRHPDEIGNDSFAQKYNVVQNVRLFRKGCEAIGITPKKYGSNRLYIPADRADDLHKAIKNILINGK